MASEKNKKRGAVCSIGKELEGIHLGVHAAAKYLEEKGITEDEQTVITGKMLAALRPVIAAYPGHQITYSLFVLLSVINEEESDSCCGIKYKELPFGSEVKH